MNDSNRYVHHLNIMAYDYYGPWSDKTGSNAPLRASSPDEANLNVDQIVQYYKGKLSNRDEQSWKKLGLGIPFYARGFVLAPGPLNNELLARQVDELATNKYKMAFDYEFVCKQIAEKKLLAFARDPNEVTPTAIVQHAASRKRMFLSWEDSISIQAKVEYAKEEGLGSVMIWKLDTDDYAGTSPTCSPPDMDKSRAQAGASRRFPLLWAIKDAI